MASCIVKALYDKINEVVIIEAHGREYKGTMKGIDKCMNVHLDTEDGEIFINGSDIVLFMLKPETRFAPYFK